MPSSVVSHVARSSARTLLRFYINYSDALNHVGRYEDAASQALSGVEMASELGLQRSLGAMLCWKRRRAAARTWTVGASVGHDRKGRSSWIHPPTTMHTSGCFRPGCTCGAASWMRLTRC